LFHVPKLRIIHSSKYFISTSLQSTVCSDQFKKDNYFRSKQKLNTMKYLFTLLLSIFVITAFSQDVTNQLGNNDGTSAFEVRDSDGDPAFAVFDNGSIIGLGSMRMPIKIISTNYLVTTGDYTLLADATGGAITVTFPVGLQVSGPIINIKKADNNNNDVTLTDGTNSVTLNSKGDGATLQYYKDTDGADPDYTGWYIIAESGNGVTSTTGTAF